MAMEGHYQSHPDGAPLILFGIPNSTDKRVDYAIEVPKLSSLILKHDLNAPLAGLDTIPEELHPPVSVVFWSFRVMVGLGFAMLGIGLWSLWCRYRGTLDSNVCLHRAAIVMGPAGFVTVLAGWVTTEVGRQPYTVYGHLLTANSVAPIAAPAVAASLIAFIAVYFFVFGAGAFYILRLMARLPRDPMPDLDEGPLRSSGIMPGLATHGATHANIQGGRHGV
jgi:cytochrome d ubiquinol oxidase subunit I